ncbi:hypothetical protein QBC47DRAFT_206701 [Echria macrotheca]|uniref:Uncharacterized protein n=1 Tax=Echria macrotheca TaxID=438768 RepID=A0AAJ0BB35_9PEZI|nr:hypothetical protein QBC47DRAFT_206701 [Echria macrotheca]
MSPPDRARKSSELAAGTVGQKSAQQWRTWRDPFGRVLLRMATRKGLSCSAGRRPCSVGASHVDRARRTSSPGFCPTPGRGRQQQADFGLVWSCRLRTALPSLGRHGRSGRRTTMICRRLLSTSWFSSPAHWASPGRELDQDPGPCIRHSKAAPRSCFNLDVNIFQIWLRPACIRRFMSPAVPMCFFYSTDAYYTPAAESQRKIQARATRVNSTQPIALVCNQAT